MFPIYNILLFLVTLTFGSLPLWGQGWDDRKLKYLLAFSGSFLLGITLLHLLPETIAQKGSQAGVLILGGFLVQQFVQRFTHGMEHGHLHSHEGHGHKVAYLPIFIGLSIHSFSEGLPLGISYEDSMTLPSLYFAIALHKLPEAMLIASLVYMSTKNKRTAWVLLVCFALITPVTGMLTALLGTYFHSVDVFVHWCVPVIAGFFLQIATTIFFESGTKSHEMNAYKWLAILSGVGLSLLTLLGSGH